MTASEMAEDPAPNSHNPHHQQEHRIAFESPAVSANPLWEDHPHQPYQRRPASIDANKSHPSSRPDSQVGDTISEEEEEEEE